MAKRRRRVRLRVIVGVPLVLLLPCSPCFLFLVILELSMTFITTPVSWYCR